ncbi:hypothetical protein PPYR_10140 [Photinus pyralis]|uniref:Peptidase M3A/M3B catalytic domain-containing protein n=1 Tax=Photinus pyralis TaxID=7054 RepID=A0A1Y1KDY8_PHOPY|nr:mitochondrial intermediate peptidase [Photinus pyralis]XP_031348979.1 mitochondrial intermediate peptidase [Photinus pyralis]KAB0796079.1 hypothetical protein PPYR_10140 [Photinus pyralis]
MKRTLINQTYNFICRRKISTWSTLTSTFNSRPVANYKPNLINTDQGLFDVPELHSHNGFFVLKDQCIEKTNVLIREILDRNRSRKLVEVFDDLSDTLCKVADLAEFIRLAHPSSLYTNAAETASCAVSGIVEKLNTDRSLYTALLNVIKDGDKFPTNDIDDLVGRLFLFDFEQSGIHLPESERTKVVELNNSLLHLGQHFVSGCGTARTVDQKIFPPGTSNLFVKEGDNVIVSGLYSNASDPIAREIAYRVYLYPDQQQDHLLTEILKHRYELAQVCGFPTYAHRALKGSTIENPETVLEFLDCLSNGLRIRADKDFDMMKEMKMCENGRKDLQVWDTDYFTKSAKKALFNVESSECAAYFSLGSCMEGLNFLFNQLYGISFVVKDISAGECWSPDVYKIEVTHENEGVLGYIYCDFYERSEKISQNCHFTIRGGKVLDDGSYQHPVVVLMLSLPTPAWSSPTLLSPSMVDALFHEMGHAMHSMLARTHYQHVTGTRCSTDLAEVPSVLMEYFCNDPRVLRTFARHFRTKDPIPEDMLQRLCAAKNLFMASEMQMQLFYSAVDQFYHREYPMEGSTTEVLAQLQDKYFSLPYIPNTAWQLRFSHLVGYGAKYYSYLVSRALASCIWQRYFENDPLNRTQGDRFRHEFLAFGGSRSPRKLVTDFLLKEPTNDVLVSSLLKEIDNKQHEIESVNKSQSFD